jgi:glycosyltransferase involved in cell wall biosynthesis
LDLRIPFILELHYLPQDIPELKRLLDDSNLMRIILISQSLKNDILKTFPLIDTSKIIVAHDGACLPALAEQPYKHSQEFLVGYIGSLYAGKGIGIIGSIAEKCPWATFHIIGGHGDEFKFWQKKLKPITNIVLHGFVPHKNTQRYLKMMNVVLAPYQNKVTTSAGLDIARWMSPLKIFEYMAYGKAIVASDIEVLREILKHEHNALLVPGDNVDKWIAAIKQLYENEELRGRLGRQAFLDVYRQHTWLHRAERVLQGLLKDSSQNVYYG